MTDLLALIIEERAEGLSFHAGQPPVVHLDGEPHSVEGPSITPESPDAASEFDDDAAGSRTP